MRHAVQWTSPAPLWGEVLDPTPVVVREGFRRPALLRFANDSFMEEFLALLASEPHRVGEYRARPESWREPLPAPAPPAVLPPMPPFLARRGARAVLPARGPSAPALKTFQEKPLKLYQPGHQRHYLVSACLVCRQPGLPDRAVEAGQTAAFVVRRLMPPAGASPRARPDAGWQEYAFVAEGRRMVWEKVLSGGRSTVDALVPGEEQLPFFEVPFEQADRRRRRVFAGVVPVGRREEYLGAPEAGPAPSPPPGTLSALDDPRTVLFKTQVSEPWRALIQKAAQAARTRQSVSTPHFGDPLPSSDQNAARKKVLDQARQDIQVGSWYVLLDLADWLVAHMPVVSQSVRQQPLERARTPEEDAVVTALEAFTITPSRAADLAAGVPGAPQVPLSLPAAVRAVLGTGVRDGLERVLGPYSRTPPAGDPDWPDFLFPVADPPDFPVAPSDVDPLGAAQADGRVTSLVRLIDAALPEEPTAAMPEARAALQPGFAPGQAWFLIRCVYDRPLCGPLEPPVTSDPTEPFQMATFFDPDAPARPVRIALPVDTSPAGLRKFDKNTAFMLSDALCGQMRKAQGMGLADLVMSVLPFPFHKDLDAGGGACKDGGVSLGLICSFSIPIITICALIMLIIIVSLLDIIFRWMPYFFLCFPFPKFSAKEGEA